MPLLIPGVTPPPPVGADRDDIHLDVRIEQAGLSVDLTGWVQAGTEGLDDPHVSPQIQRTAGMFGGIVTGVDVPPRRVTLDVLVWLDGGPEYLAARRRLGDVTSPLEAGRLWVTCRTGVSVTTRYIDGWRVVEQPVPLGRGTWGADGWQLLQLGWDCADVWWREPEAFAPVPWSGPGPVAPFFSAHFLPLAVIDSTILGAPTRVVVPGDRGVACPATWTLDGPGTLWTVTHVQSGRSWSMDVSGLPRPITVVTVPGPAAQVTDGDGVNRWTKLAAPYDLFPLPPGEQDVTVTVTGATTDTLVHATGDGRRWRAFT